MNILLGSVLATISLTIPAVLIVGFFIQPPSEFFYIRSLRRSRLLYERSSQGCHRCVVFWGVLF